LFETPERKGELYFWALWVHTFTDLPTGAFAQSQGLVSAPNGGFTDPDKDFVAISALYWQETFKRDASEFSYRIGHLHASSTWATVDYLSDDRAFFMATPLSSPLGANWADSNRGLGAVAAFDAGSWYLSAGFSDAKGSQKQPDFDSFSDGKFKYIAEVGIETSLGGRPGEYKITPSYTDRTGNTDVSGDRSGWGLILTARQGVADNVNVFAQYRHSWDRAVGGFDRLLTAGLMVDPPFGWTDDLMGVGVFYGHPIDPLDRDESGIEAFYRLQLTHRLDVTPDIQIYRAGRATRTDNTVVVAGLRLRVVF
jgi:carbohydrate-selective porin OprB